MKKIICILIISVIGTYLFAQDDINEVEKTLKNFKKELNYLKKRNSDLRVQLKQVKKELSTFKEIQKDNMDSMNNTLLQLSSNLKANKELIELVKAEQEITNEDIDKRIKSVVMKIWIILLFLIVVLIIAILLPIMISKKRVKDIQLLKKEFDVKINSLQEEIKKLTSSLNEKIEKVQKSKS